ncbi:MAG TPA: oligosaccharide flippase family protein, partial [Chitinophagaceae bacterium]|nr:oligosaccharide flippase family protein [Chitinophagaceae bacterium]
MKELVNNKLVFRNFFSLTLAQGINALLQLLVVPFVIIKIGIENFGLVAVAQVVMFLLSTLAEYGYGQTGSRSVAQNRTDTEKLSKLFYHSIYLRIILCSVGFFLLLLLSLIFSFIQQHFILYALAFVFVPGQALLPSWFFQGMEKLQWMAAALLLSKILFVLLVFLFISRPDHTSLFIFFLGLGNIITAIAASVFIVNRYHLKALGCSLKEIKRLLIEGAPVTAANLTMNLMQYGNLFILRLYSN